MLSAIERERNAVNVLHHEPRSSVIQCVCVVEPRDQWMVQLGQGPLFAGKAFAARRGKPGVTQDLDRDLSTEVSAFSKINDSHSAFAQQLQDLVRAEFLEDQGSRNRIGKRFLRKVGYVAIEQRVAARVLVQHGQNVDDEFLVAAACRLQENSLLALGHVCGVMK